MIVNTFGALCIVLALINISLTITLVESERIYLIFWMLLGTVPIVIFAALIYNLSSSIEMIFNEVMRKSS